MTLQDLFARYTGNGVSLGGKRLAIDLGEAGGFYLAENGASRPELGAEADCTFWMSPEDCAKLHAGELDLDAAFIDGRLRTKGDLAAALAFVGQFPIRGE
jgi:putative sterol carrier protein